MLLWRLLEQQKFSPCSDLPIFRSSCKKNLGSCGEGSRFFHRKIARPPPPVTICMGAKSRRSPRGSVDSTSEMLVSLRARAMLLWRLLEQQKFSPCSDLPIFRSSCKKNLGSWRGGLEIFHRKLTKRPPAVAWRTLAKRR